MKNPTIVNKLGSALTALNPFRSKETPVARKESQLNVRELTYNDITWVDIITPTKKELATLTEKYAIDPLHLEACSSRGQLDRLEIEDKYLFILIHAPKYNRKENKISTTRICFFVGKKFLISVHKGNHESFSKLPEELTTNEIKQNDFFKKSGGHLLYQLLNTLSKDLVAVHEKVLKEVDEIEDLVFDVNTSGAYEITRLRQKIVRLKRVLSPFKNIVQELSTDPSHLTESLAKNFRYLTNEVNKLRELLEEAKEVVEIYKDADFTVSTERTNKILGILTIIFTLGMPATIVGSFYGMNVFVPGGVEAGPWTLLGPFTSFYFAIALAVVPAALMLWLFKQKKWF